MEKNFYDRPIDSDITRSEEIKKLTTGQGEDCTTGYSSGYAYMKNHHILIPVDLSRQKELDADPKAIPQIEFFGQLKKPDNAIVANESMFVLTTFKKIKETRLKVYQGSASLMKDDTL